MHRRERMEYKVYIPFLVSRAIIIINNENMIPYHQKKNCINQSKYIDF